MPIPCPRANVSGITAEHPDPDGATLAIVCDYLRSVRKRGREIHSFALFCDFMSLPQKPRHKGEGERFERGLKVMGSLYASATGTTVLQHKFIAPERGCHPYDTSGWCALAPESELEEPPVFECGCAAANMLEQHKRRRPAFHPWHIPLPPNVAQVPL